MKIYYLSFLFFILFSTTNVLIKTILENVSTNVIILKILSPVSGVPDEFEFVVTLPTVDEDDSSVVVGVVVVVFEFTLFSIVEFVISLETVFSIVLFFSSSGVEMLGIYNDSLFSIPSEVVYSAKVLPFVG